MERVKLGFNLCILIAFHSYAGIMAVWIDMDECNTRLDFKNIHPESIFLSYDGSILTDSAYKPCVINITSYNQPGTTSSICVRLYHGYNYSSRIDCNNYRGKFKFYFGTYGKNYVTCQDILFDLCEDSLRVFAEFRPWDTMRNDFEIEIYRSEQDIVESNVSNDKSAKMSPGVVVLWMLVVVAALLIICCAVLFFLRRSKTRTNNRGQEGDLGTVQNGEPLQLTPSAPEEPQQSTDLSADPPSYTDIMAAGNTGNDVTQHDLIGDKSNVDGSHPLMDDGPEPKGPSSIDTDSIPEAPPPPYPGYT